MDGAVQQRQQLCDHSGLVRLPRIPPGGQSIHLVQEQNCGLAPGGLVCSDLECIPQPLLGLACSTQRPHFNHLWVLVSERGTKAQDSSWYKLIAHESKTPGDC